MPLQKSLETYWMHHVSKEDKVLLVSSSWVKSMVGSILFCLSVTFITFLCRGYINIIYITEMESLGIINSKGLEIQEIGMQESH